MEEARVEALKRRVQQERETSGSRRARFSKELKQAVAELLNTRGWGHRRVSKALGLSESSIHRWAEKIAPRAKNQPSDEKSQFKKATIVEAAAKHTLAAPSVGELRLEFACGARVTGLTLEQVAELLRRQS
jgi:transposase-like protein